MVAFHRMDGLVMWVLIEANWHNAVGWYKNVEERRQKNSQRTH